MSEENDPVAYEVDASGAEGAAESFEAESPDDRKSKLALLALVVSAASLFVSATNFFLTQVRDPSIQVYVGSGMPVYYPRDGGFGMYLPLAFINNTQRGGSVLRARASLRRDNAREAYEFEWAQFSVRDPKTRDYLHSSEPGPVSVPASSSVSRTVWFVWRPDSRPTFTLEPGRYTLRVAVWTRDEQSPDATVTRSFIVDEDTSEGVGAKSPVTSIITFEGFQPENAVSDK